MACDRYCGSPSAKLDLPQIPSVDCFVWRVAASLAADINLEIFTVVCGLCTNSLGLDCCLARFRGPHQFYVRTSRSRLREVERSIRSNPVGRWRYLYE